MSETDVAQPAYVPSSNPNSHALRDENGMTAAMRGRANSIASRAAEKKLKAELKANMREKAKEIAHAMADKQAKALERRFAEGLAIPLVERNPKEMQAFGYKIINRELQRLSAMSESVGLNEEEVQTLVRLISALNVTAKTERALSPEADPTQQREGESIEEYRARLEKAANG